MKVVIIGSGGREHAIAWKVGQSKQVEQVFVAPGNAGTELEAHTTNVAIDPNNFQELINFAKTHAIDLTIVGPEAQLAGGIVDAFTEAGLACFGPTQKAAQLEASKSFSKAFMEKYHIPTASYATFSELEPALAYVRQQRFPTVIKADGLAAGKGVVIAENLNDAEAALKSMLTDNQFGEASATVVIEEFLTGVEASFIVMTDGKTALPLASSQDHKRRFDGDTGPNTGGMGAYSPAPMVTEQVHQEIMRTVIEPTIAGMKSEGIPYSGFLYAGLMISPEGELKVLEFNCRLGDPETQVIMMRLESELAELCLAAIAGKLDQTEAKWRKECALGVVLASNGYPGTYKKEEIINGLLQNDSYSRKIFHAGTQNKSGNIITTGGRVLCATALGDSFANAQKNAYNLVTQVCWDSMSYRTDIGHQAVRLES